ncbi:hypothetical protein E8L99_21640 [Phreatobacter aquaticus]|uniref:Uncharacterized protein n=1 Tax=Phreatobacter aquaticus TaxID=2570229 RepID=A0A4D7QKN4_9HYPH|nr:hypothetical protein E8L99_21640 [Phreatobacter aquaticus]
MLNFRNGIWAALALFCSMFASHPPAGAQPVSDPRPPIAADRLDPPRVRPGHIAVREEFDAAIAAGRREALELFIARHPAESLAEEARRRLEVSP